LAFSRDPLLGFTDALVRSTEPDVIGSTAVATVADGGGLLRAYAASMVGRSVASISFTTSSGTPAWRSGMVSGSCFAGTK